MGYSGNLLHLKKPSVEVEGPNKVTPEKSAPSFHDVPAPPAEELFRLASQAVDGILYDWYPGTGVVRRSGNLQKLIGFSADEAAPSANWWQERIHPEDAASASLSVLSALDKNQNTYETEFRFRHADGHWVYLSDRGFIVRDELGTPIRVVGSTYDVTEQKKLEQELKDRNKELKFQADILEATHDAVVALDANLCIRYCNAAAEKLYGVRLADVLGQPLPVMHGYAWLAPEDEQRSLSDLRDRGSWKGEYIHILRDGTQLVVYCTVNVLAPEAGGGMVAVIRDITERKRSEMDVRNRTLRLVRANDDLLHFAYAVSHDLQAPLRTITSFSQLLALKYKQKLDGQGGEFIRWIIDASTRMDTMLRDLLQFAKVAGGNAEFSEVVCLQDAFSTALDGLRSSIEETQAVITADRLPTVACDAGQMVQLFQNLIGNSLKYRRPDTAPHIHVSAREAADGWEITVRDNGMGFEPKHAEQIFGVFQRLHGKEVAGTGIGLTICKRIVERRGGKIWAEGQLGAGATFHFSIPHSTAAFHAAPSMDWERVHTVLENRPQPDEAEMPMAHFDELFKTLDLAQAIVRNFDGTILIWTKGAERLFGWTEAEAQGQQLHDLIATEFPKSRAAIEAALLRNGEWTGELKAHKKDGRVVWLASHKALYRDGSGRPQSVIEVHNDISALKQAEAALTRSAEQRDVALSAGRMGVWSWDKRTNQIEWSETIETLLGMRPGSFEGTWQAYTQRVHPDDRETVQQRISKAFEGRPEYVIENRLLREDGSYCWVRGQGRVVCDERHQPVGLMGVVWDISDNKQNEADRQFLLDLGSKLSQASGSERLADIATTETGKYLGVWRCVCSEIDHVHKEIHNFSEYCLDCPSGIGRYSLDEFAGILAELAQSQVVCVSDVEKDARTINSLESGYRRFGTRAFATVPLRREGRWVGNLTVASDEVRHWQDREVSLLREVGERLWPAIESARLLQEARERQEQFESTFEQAAVGLAHVAPDGRWLRVNKRLCQITGYTKEELLEGRFQDITHPDDRAIDLQYYNSLQRGHLASYAVEKRYFQKSGLVVWVNLTVALVRDAEGKPKYAISVVEDISARRKTAQQLVETSELASLRLREIEAIYSQAPVGLLFLDCDLRFVRINEYLASKNGFSVAEHIGRTVSEILPEAGPRLEPLLRGVLATRKPIIEAQLRGATPGSGGAELIWLVSYFPFEGPDGELLGLNAVVQDITQRKQTETAWRETAERLRIATSVADLGVFAWDATEDHVVWENERMYEIIGRSKEDGPVNHQEFLRSVIHPEDAEGYLEALCDASKPGRFFRQVCRIRRGDGVPRWAEISGQFDFAAEGDLVRFVGVLADVTERMEGNPEI